LLMYGVGREIHYTDMPTVRAINHDAARNNYRFSSLILAIVNSNLFQKRTAAAPVIATRN